MTLRIDVTSKPRGSNPGGNCRILYNGWFDGYFKYCFGSRIQGASSFIARHQPIYEAITFQLVRALGLSTSEFFVALNPQRDIFFNGWRTYLNHDPSGREYYFVSKIFKSFHPTLSESESRAIVSFERAYLDAIMVGDIVGKPNNYVTFGTKQEHDIVYLDLGCSFVHSVGGLLSLPHQSHINSEKVFKQTMRRLDSRAILIGGQDSVNLAELVNGLPSLPIPTLNPLGESRVDSLIGGDEIREIRYLLASGLESSLSSLKDKGLLTKAQ